tara:strand:- start:2915 stop:3388 length:474 start_codon:yes stop_codon:yes gene_type:complete
MTNEEKQAVLQFMGTVYGDAHKQDQMLIGQSGNLRPNSHVMKERFEEVIRTPTEQQQYLAAQQQNAPAPAPVQEPAASPVVEVNVEQAAQELAAVEIQSAPPAVTIDPTGSNQLEFDLSEPSKIDKLIDLIKEQNLLLKKISLKLDNGKGAKATKKG